MPLCRFCDTVDPYWWPTVGDIRKVLGKRERKEQYVMARVVTNKKAHESRFKTRTSRSVETPDVELPTERRTVSKAFEDFHTLIHGEKKTGKTLLADASESGVETFFAQFDPPQKAYNLYEHYCPDYATFLAVLEKLEEASKGSKKFPFHRCAVDGIDLMYHECMKWVCKRHGVVHPSEGDYGDVWSALRHEFTGSIRRLMALPCGVWFICHSVWKETKDRHTGVRDERLVPAMTSTAEEIVNGLVDATFAIDWHGKQRILILQGDQQVAAGHRMDRPNNKHFRDRVTGEPLEEITLGKTVKQGYQNLLDAYNNQYHLKEKKESDKPKVEFKFKKKGK